MSIKMQTLYTYEELRLLTQAAFVPSAEAELSLE